MGAKKSITKNYIFNLIYQILVIIIPLVTTPYISRVLGANGIGVYSYTYSIVTYFCMFAALGTVTFAQREIAYCRDNIENATVQFWNILIVRIVASIMSILIYSVVIINSRNRIIAIMQGLYILGVATDISWFFQGLEEFGKVVFRNMIIKILNVVFIFAFVKESKDLWLYVISMSLFPIVANIALWFYLPKYLIKISISKISPQINIKEILQLFIPTIAIQVYTVMDKTMIGVLTKDDAQNGYYENAIGMVRLCLLLITSFGMVMIPRIAYLFSNNQREQMCEYMKRTYRFVWLLAIPIFIGLIFVADLFVPWFFGDGFDEVIILIQICSGLIIAVGLNDVTGTQYLVPTKKQNIYTMTVIIGASVNFVLNLILIPKFYAVGAAFASVIAEIVIAITQFIFIIYIEKSFKWRDIFGNMSKYIFAGSVMCVGLCIIKQACMPSILGTGIFVLFGSALYFVCLFLLKDELFFYMINKALVVIRQLGKEHR